MSSSDSSSENEAAEETDLIYYLPLQQAIRKVEWDVATRFVEADPDAVGALLSAEAETPLILAAKQGPRSNHFLARLLVLMTPDQVAQRDNTGTTALHAAAMHGNISGVQLLLRSQPALTNIPNKVGHLPLHLAAAHGHRKTVRFLFGLTRYDVEPNPYQGDHGVALMRYAMNARFYDIAISILQRHPTSAWQDRDPRDCFNSTSCIQILGTVLTALSSIGTAAHKKASNMA
ncbi:hypothetical protein RJ640_003575 [Escallonia rubra]|uniref:Uncharacterized protein n=1 Tax=Escallonia rubra TaxID=112253 RepID=A0AA88U2H7_9ASTE|nr:hypothetical protein RJ640_003575 [Escallonia rubra]